MRRPALVIAVLATALAFSATAAAAPATFGEARQGGLHVISSILWANRSVDMRGGWFNNNVSCLANRRLHVEIQIQRTRGGSGSGFGEGKTGLVMNCAEGGPNFGFTISPTQAGMACPNGTWRPGRYDLLTRTRHVHSGLTAVATLSLTRRQAC